MRRWLGWVVIGLATLWVVASVAHGQQTTPAPDAPTLGAITDAYAIASRTWLARLMPVARQTFVVLAGIEVAMSGALYGLRREHMDELAARFVIKFGLLAFLFAVITAFPFWIPAIVNGFAATGERAIGATGLINPSDVIDIGVTITGQLFSALDGLGLLRNPATLLMAVISGVIVVLAYVAVAAQLVLALVESYVVMSAGIVFLALAGWRISAGYAEGFLNYVVTVGIRIFFLYLVAAVGVELSRQWVVLLKANAVWGPYGTAEWQVVGGAVVFALLVRELPKTIASRITAMPSFGIAAALRAA